MRNFEELANKNIVHADFASFDYPISKCKSGESDASLPEAVAAKSSIVLGFVLERAHESNRGPESRLGV
jgi:hypothetical protein